MPFATAPNPWRRARKRSRLRLLRRKTTSRVHLPARLTRVSNRAAKRAPGKPTWLGVTSRQSRSRISNRLRLCSRLSARVLAVGRGGKTLFCKQVFQVGLDGGLVALDRQQIIGALFEKDLLPGFLLGMHGIGDQDLPQEVLAF